MYFFDYMALQIECRFNKNSLLQCYFLVILPAGLVTLLETINIIKTGNNEIREFEEKFPTKRPTPSGRRNYYERYYCGSKGCKLQNLQSLRTLLAVLKICNLKLPKSELVLFVVFYVWCLFRRSRHLKIRLRLRMLKFNCTMLPALIGEILAKLILAYISESQKVWFFWIYFSESPFQKISNTNLRKIWSGLIFACVIFSLRKNFKKNL